MIPSIWRVELFHPLSVHFPIALLLVGTTLRVLGCARFFSRKYVGYWNFVGNCGALLLVIGALSSWVAYYTGTLAELEVNSTLCDPEQTHIHGDYAYYASWIFTVVALLELAPLRFRAFRHSFVLTLVLLLSLGGTVLMAYVSHLGAQLTYNQGAGVFKPSPECTEFE